jgi:acyl-CoA reductase-like NAD-dependent aldehyde dehydrogenase
MHVLENRFELAAGLADVVAGVRKLPAPPFRTEVSYLPLGVVSLIVPFNWPLAILAASLPQALVAGNTVIVKAPPTTPLSFVRTIQLIAAELPAGVLNVVSGQDAVLGPVLIQDPRVRKVCFTGSVGGGKRIMAMAADNLTRVTLELGGNDPAIVLADAQVTEETIGKLYVGAFLTTGQVCMAMKRLYVHRSHYDAVVEGLSGAVGAQKIGPGLHPDATMGPLNSDRQREYVTELLDEARENAEVRELAEPVDDAAFARGQFMRPSLVLDPSADLRIVTEEQFGPTLPIIPFDDEADAIAQANDTWSGLCSSVWSSDPEHAGRVAAQLRTGTTFINAHNAPFLDERAPFGGFNQSGMGREMGEQGILEFTDTHSVSYPA